VYIHSFFTYLLGAYIGHLYKSFLCIYRPLLRVFFGYIQVSFTGFSVRIQISFTILSCVYTGLFDRSLLCIHRSLLQIFLCICISLLQVSFAKAVASASFHGSPLLSLFVFCVYIGLFCVYIGFFYRSLLRKQWPPHRVTGTPFFSLCLLCIYRSLLCVYSCLFHKSFWQEYHDMRDIHVVYI